MPQITQSKTINGDPLREKKREKNSQPQQHEARQRHPIEKNLSFQRF